MPNICCFPFNHCLAVKSFKDTLNALIQPSMSVLKVIFKSSIKNAQAQFFNLCAAHAYKQFLRFKRLMNTVMWHQNIQN